MEGLTGIEPALSAWEAEVLPLNYSPEVASVNASAFARVPHTTQTGPELSAAAAG